MLRPGPFLSGRGHFLCPLRSHFHKHVCFSPPHFFFVCVFFVAFEAGYRIGLRDASGCTATTLLDRNPPPNNPHVHGFLFVLKGELPRVSPELSESSENRSPPPSAPLSSVFFWMKGECCAFFCGVFFRRQCPTSSNYFARALLFLHPLFFSLFSLGFWVYFWPSCDSGLFFSFVPVLASDFLADFRRLFSRNGVFGFGGCGEDFPDLPKFQAAKKIQLLWYSGPQFGFQDLCSRNVFWGS